MCDLPMKQSRRLTRAQPFSCAGCEPVLMLGRRSSLLLTITKKQGWAKGTGRPKAQSVPPNWTLESLTLGHLLERSAATCLLQ